MKTNTNAYKVVPDTVAEEYKQYLTTGDENYYQKAREHGARLQDVLLKKAHDEAMYTVASKPSEPRIGILPRFFRKWGVS